jgi:hypothetical protein
VIRLGANWEATTVADFTVKGESVSKFNRPDNHMAYESVKDAVRLVLHVKDTWGEKAAQ